MNKTIKHLINARVPLVLALSLLSVTALADAKHSETTARQDNGGSAPDCMACHDPNGDGNTAT